MTSFDATTGYVAKAPKVLVVEDSVVTARSLAELLIDEGYDAVVALDGASAMAQIDGSIDLVITDLAMPKMSGLEVIEAIRAEEATRDIPIIITSAHDETRMRVAGFERGADDFVPKPVDVLELLARVKRLLTRAARYRRVTRESLSDGLTSVLNRRGIEECLAHELKLSARTGAAVFLLLIDLDDFKAVNDRHGHLIGDLALCAIAQTLKATCRTTDRIGRFGGDEFLVVASGFDTRQALELKQRIRRSMPVTLTLTEQSLAVDVSVGVAVAEPGEAADSLIGRADASMYADKADHKRMRG